jgi:hypothetical protein
VTKWNPLFAGVALDLSASSGYHLSASSNVELGVQVEM